MTGNLSQRLCYHNTGRCKYTAKFMPWRIAYTEQFMDKRSALSRERQIKKWTRAKKEALIAVLVSKWVPATPPSSVMRWVVITSPTVNPVEDTEYCVTVLTGTPAKDVTNGVREMMKTSISE